MSPDKHSWQTSIDKIISLQEAIKTLYMPAPCLLQHLWHASSFALSPMTVLSAVTRQVNLAHNSSINCDQISWIQVWCSVRWVSTTRDQYWSYPDHHINRWSPRLRLACSHHSRWRRLRAVVRTNHECLHGNLAKIYGMMRKAHNDLEWPRSKLRQHSATY